MDVASPKQFRQGHPRAGIGEVSGCNGVDSCAIHRGFRGGSGGFRGGFRVVLEGVPRGFRGVPWGSVGFRGGSVGFRGGSAGVPRGFRVVASSGQCLDCAAFPMFPLSNGGGSAFAFRHWVEPPFWAEQPPFKI